MVQLQLKTSTAERSFLSAMEAYKMTGENLPQVLDVLREWNIFHNRSIQILRNAIKEVYEKAIQEYWSNTLRHVEDHSSLQHHLHLKLEGVTRCALHFQQKKRYIHAYQNGSLVEKGTAGIKRDTVPLLKFMDENLVRLAMRGWYLVRRGAKNLVTVPSHDIESEMAREGTSLFFPGKGWISRIQGIERFDVSSDIFGTAVNWNGFRWIKFTDTSGDSLEWLDDTGEKWNRSLAVAEYIVGSLNNLASGLFCVADLMESSQPENFVSASINRSRELYGMEPANSGCKVPFVRVIGNAPPFQNKYQDPIIVIRERLQIDVSHYMGIAAKMFAENSGTIAGIMARSSVEPEQADRYIRELKEKVDGILSGPVHCHPVQVRPEPITIPLQWVSHFQLQEFDVLHCKNACIQKPRGFSLVGSVWKQGCTGVCHYYAKSDCLHEQYVLNVAQQIAFQRDIPKHIPVDMKDAEA